MLRVGQLLEDCLTDVCAGCAGTVPLIPDGPAYAAARRTFLAAGLTALRDDLPEAGWVQLSLAPRQDALLPLYRRLAATARELIAARAVSDFFFMHKPPGLRVRFRTPERGPAGDWLRRELLRRFEGTDDLECPPACGVYEPETYLFGGVPAMTWVHRLFTADSLAWLDHHTGPDAGQGGGRAGWRVSLLLLREVIDGLGIVGSEHRGVWEAVRDEAGRALAGGLSDEAMRRAAAGIRGEWDLDRERRLAALPPGSRPVLGAHREELGRAARRWREEYFESGDAVLGPRRAAARFVLFHWNRGGFSRARQSLLAEALAADGAAEG